ncbi:MAG: hypothetical protein JXA37_02465 [Chloroflexia bacterium]|nr:hypothetical protein [Chloroflexia bacterium]
MAEFFANLHTLEWVYLAFFCVALLYALFLAFVGFGHGHAVDHAGDFGHTADLHGGPGEAIIAHSGDIGHLGEIGHAADIGHAGDVGHAGEISHGVEGGHAGEFDADLDLDGDGDSHQVMPWNPIVISTFIAGFGGSGLLATQALGLHPWLSLLLATPGGLVLGGGMYALYRKLVTLGSAATPITWQELRGTKALVTTPIRQDGLGEIVYVARGSRHRATARTVDGRALPKNTIVTVLEFKNSMAIVDERYVD